jgi:hypothetical protein
MDRDVMGLAKKLTALTLVSLALLASSCGREPNVSTFRFVTGTGSYAAGSMPRPVKAARFGDPSFTITLQRITEKKDGYSGPGSQNEYSKSDPGNCDGTLLILRGNDAAYYLYNPENCALLHKITVFDECNFCEPEPRWDRADPQVFYYIRDSELRNYNTSSKRSRVIHDFKKDFPDAAYVTTKGEGDASLDRRYWCLMVQDSRDKLLAVICYDMTEDRVVGRKAGGFPDSLNWVGMSMSGEHCIVGYEDVAIYTQVFSRDFLETVKLPEGSAGHGDAARAADGRDVYVYQNVRNDYICLADMAEGTETKLLHIPFEVNPDIGLHVSGNCAGTPGWALVSTYGAENPPAGKSHSWMDNQLFMLELKSSPRVWRVAHNFSYTSRDSTGEKSYYAEAFAAVDTAGTRVFWGSNWGDFRQDYSDAYQALLPAGWAHRIR